MKRKLLAVVALIFVLALVVPMSKERPGPEDPPWIFYTIRNLLSLL